MRIRDKFIIIQSIVFLNSGLLVFLSLFAIQQINSYKATSERNTALVVKARSVFNLMKDLSITAFSPDTYGRLKDVFYYENFNTTMANWEESVKDFKGSFKEFINDPIILKMRKSNSLIEDEYNTALTMSNKVFTQLNSVDFGFKKLNSSKLLLKENSYQYIVSSPDIKISGLFSEVRITSYYLKNNFESYMNYFVNAIDKEIDYTMESVVFAFILIIIFSIILSIFLSLIFGNQIIKDVYSLGASISTIAAGDFSRHIKINSRNELDILVNNLNALTDKLKNNIDLMLNIVRDVGSSIDFNMELKDIQKIIINTAKRESAADGVILINKSKEGSGLGFILANGVLSQNSKDLENYYPFNQSLRIISDDSEYSSIITCKLNIESENAEYLIAVTAKGRNPFTYFDFILLSSFSEFAALSIDNFIKYKKILEMREAELQSLQAKIQPHFLYNVMNGMIGLNRMGKAGEVELAILDLKDLLRYTLENEPIVELSEEFDFIRKYLELQKLRFGDRFDYIIDSDSSSRTLLIPKLLIQPIVENALIHGIELLEKDGLIVLTAISSNKSECVVHVKDNGVGFETSKIDMKRIGISNVDKRLQLAFPGSYIKIDSSLGHGCCIEIHIKTRS